MIFSFALLLDAEEHPLDRSPVRLETLGGIASEEVQQARKQLESNCSQAVVHERAYEYPLRGLVGKHVWRCPSPRLQNVPVLLPSNCPQEHRIFPARRLKVSSAQIGVRWVHRYFSIWARHWSAKAPSITTLLNGPSVGSPDSQLHTG